jgi:hypothetical protein
MFTGDSLIIGDFTFDAGTGVSFISSNLLNLFPDFTPHQSVANASDLVVRLITKSPFFLIIEYECREGLTDI